MSSIFLNVLTGMAVPNITTSDPYSQSIVSILVTLLFVMMLCVTYYPLFASVDTPVPIIGHTIGAFFAAILLVLALLREYLIYSGCWTGCQQEGLPYAVQFLSDVPIILLELFLVVWFLWSIGHDIYLMIIPSKNTNSSPEYEHLKDHLVRVKHRLSREQDEEHSKMKSGIKKILFTIYPYDPGFKFPLRFLSGMVVAMVIVYQVSLMAIYTCINLTVALDDTRKLLFELYDELQAEVNATTTVLSDLEKYIKPAGYIMVVAIALITVAMICGTIFCFVQLFLTFRNVSEHLHKSTRGDLSFLANDFPTLHRSLLSSFRYPGYLIAYSVWAWTVFSLLLTLIVVIVLVGGLLMYFLYKLIGPQIAVLIIGLAWTQGLYWSQFFITQFVFLEKAYPDSEHFVLNNRRLMHWFTYFYIFQNAFVGLFSTFIRIFMSLAFGILTFSRLDRLLLLKGLESFDAAHRTYIGMIYLDYTQNNSVMKVFCHILLEEIKLKKLREGEISENQETCCLQPKHIGPNELLNVASVEPGAVSRPHVSQRAYNRWRVAYTLIRNEELQELTATALSKNQRKQSLRERMGHLNEVYGFDPVENEDEVNDHDDDDIDEHHEL